MLTFAYLYKDLGRPKVDATGELCRQIDPDLELEVVFERFRRTMEVGNCVFMCVDSIVTRKHVFETLKDTVGFICDGRMSAEVLRVITICDEAGRAYYPRTLFTAAEAHAGPCTAKTTIYCANIAAGFMLAQFTKYLRLMPIEPDKRLIAEVDQRERTRFPGGTSGYTAT